nr:hypothetical protein [Lachnospiraceae bacterium]
PFDGYEKKRINLLSPSLNIEHVFGGIATALKFYKQLGEALGCDMRVIITDSILNENAMVEMDGYEIVSNKKDSTASKQIVVFSQRYNETIPVGKNDIFMATGWWTAYTILPVIKWQEVTYGVKNKLIYFIQDYEPGFYKWSSHYLLADSTYKTNKADIIAIFNSKLLYEFFKENKYKFAYEYYFEPSLNDKLKDYLMEHKDSFERKKKIIFYGRPTTMRNCFELVVTALNEWVAIYDKANEWEVISAGEEYSPVTLNNGQKINVVGKLSLDDYAKMMLETKIGISLMVSPHPSYPPLEMSTFGIKVITNTYANKDLSSFNENIISLDDCSAESIAETLVKLCDDENLNNNVVLGNEYVNGNNEWNEIIDNITHIL